MMAMMIDNSSLPSDTEYQGISIPSFSPNKPHDFLGSQHYYIWRAHSNNENVQSEGFGLKRQWVVFDVSRQAGTRRVGRQERGRPQ